MKSLLFEKKASMPIGRQIILEKDQTVILYYQGGFVVAESKAGFPHAAEAEAYAERVAECFRHNGFSEYDNPDLGQTGSLSSLEGPRGPGRIRVDAVGDVFFDEKTHAIPKLKQGQRVLVLGAKKESPSTLPFMFGSPWVATEIRELRPEKKNPRLELPVATRERLVKKAGDALRGFKKEDTVDQGYSAGQLIYGYGTGIFRVIEAKGMSIAYEQVYSAKLLRATGMVDKVAKVFCRPVPDDIVEELRDDSLVR